MSNTVKKSTFLFPVRDAVDADKVTLVPVSRDFYIKATREINSKRKRLQRHAAVRAISCGSAMATVIAAVITSQILRCSIWMLLSRWMRTSH